MQKQTGKRNVGILLILGAIFSLLLLNNSVISQIKNSDIKIGSDKPPLANVNPKDYSSPFIQAAKQVMPSIVQIVTVIENKKQNPFQDDEFFKFFPFFMEPQEKEQIATGSGVIISEDGYIVTNNHVVDGDRKSVV